MLRVLFALIALAFAAPVVAQSPIPASSNQLVLGVAPNWDSSQVTLKKFERKGNQWVQVGDAWNGRLGKNGLVWGLGLHKNPSGAAVKQESDGRAPAGAFYLGGAWGYDAQIAKHRNLFYRQVSTRDLWVEDPASPQYNRHVILDHEPATEWEKKQQMKQNDYPHSLKLFIAHNAPPRAQNGHGSAIFFHIWRGGGSKPTAGCTTMVEDRLRSLIRWVDPSEKPVYVLLPKSEYDKLRAPWGLP